MNELITRLSENAGINTDQAHKALETIKDYVKEKFPMMAGAVDNLFATSAPTVAAVVDLAAPVVHENVLDKISDVIPGEAGQKVEDFAKDTAHKAEEVFDNVKDKLSGFFGSDKK